MRIPPKILRERVQPRSADTRESDGTPPDGHGGTGALPVRAAQETLPAIKALQEMLVAERTMARRRLIGLGIFFLFVLLIAIGAGLFIGATFYLRIRNDVNTVAGELGNLKQQALRTQQQAETVVSRLGDEAEKLREVLLREQQKALEETRRDILGHGTVFASGVNTLTQTVHMLEERNLALTREMEGLRGKLPELSKILDDMRRELALLRSPELERVSPPPQPASRSFVSVPVAAQPDAPPITFRIPLPE